ncbi:MAG: DUF5672 family protein [Pseudomonadota bacterium]
MNTTLGPNLTEKPRLRLKTITLCAVSSSNLMATVQAMEASLSQIEFAGALLFTDQEAPAIGLKPTSEIQVVSIDKIQSSEAYSHFLLERLPRHISTSHCLVVQWDGHVIDAGRWNDEFLKYDYIGASWPQFVDGHDVGNGGFSLRSVRLMKACGKPEFRSHHPEDVAICRTNRAFLEDLGMHFAPVELADQFSAERASDPSNTFGYHGAFLMPKVMGVDAFWRVYRGLSDRKTIWTDFGSIFSSVGRRQGGAGRALILLRDRMLAALKR